MKHNQPIGIMLVKADSRRLPGKNLLPFHGRPLFTLNLWKLLKVFEEVVVDSDSEAVLTQAEEMGATPRIRPAHLNGHEVPSIVLFRSLVEDFPEAGSFVSVQANSPNTPMAVISTCAEAIQLDSVAEVITCFSSGEKNGSVWAMTYDRSMEGPPQDIPRPSVMVVDDSIDIHTQDDFDAALLAHKRTASID